MSADMPTSTPTKTSVHERPAMGWRAIPSTVTAIRRGTTLSNEQVAALLAKGVKLR